MSSCFLLRKCLSYKKCSRKCVSVTDVLWYLPNNKGDNNKMKVSMELIITSPWFSTSSRIKWGVCLFKKEERTSVLGEICLCCGWSQRGSLLPPGPRQGHWLAEAESFLCWFKESREEGGKSRGVEEEGENEV